MKYGVNTKLVEEVIEFATVGNLFITTSTIPEDIIFIEDFKRAEYLSREEVYGEDEYTWKDIRELEMSEIWGKYYSMHEPEKPSLDGLLSVFIECLKGRVSNPYSYFYDDIVAEFKNCAVNRAINGKTDNFYEKIFEIYKSGGLPCGWDGDYPQGKIVAYFPHI